MFHNDINYLVTIFFFTHNTSVKVECFEMSKESYSMIFLLFSLFSKYMLFAIENRGMLWHTLLKTKPCLYDFSHHSNFLN